MKTDNVCGIPGCNDDHGRSIKHARAIEAFIDQYVGSSISMADRGDVDRQSLIRTVQRTGAPRGLRRVIAGFVTLGVIATFVAAGIVTLAQTRADIAATRRACEVRR